MAFSLISESPARLSLRKTPIFLEALRRNITDFLIQYFTNYGTVGLFVIALAESVSVFSPILPDLLLIPLAIANPQNAIYYGLVATVASILGGLIGYAIGKMCGLRVIKRFIPLHYIDQMRLLADKYGVWAIYIGALLPIPTK